MKEDEADQYSTRYTLNIYSLHNTDYHKNMWALYAVVSSIIWGANYLFYEKVLNKISIPTLYAIDLTIGGITFLIIGLLTGSITKDFSTIQNTKSVQILILASVITSFIADLLIAMAIQSKNATVSTLIEISYPIFIILLGWILFKENTLTLSVAIGGLLIFAGITIIYVFNK